MGIKKSLLLCLITFSCIGLISCNNEDDSYPLDTVFSVEFECDSEYLVADGASTAHFNIGIFDNNGHIIEPLMDRTIIRYRGEVIARGTTVFDFTPSSPGGHRFLFELDGKVIDNHTIYAVEGNRAVVIPVIFHVSEGESSDVSEKVSQILEGLNSKFNNLDVNSLVENSRPTQIRFKLATVDLEGIPLQETGVSRYPQTHELFQELSEVWQRGHYWNPDHYINVWIGKNRGYGPRIWGSNFPVLYSYRVPKDTLPDPSWSYRTDHSSTPPIHRPEGVKFTYRDSIDELYANNSNLNYLTLYFGQFLGLTAIRNQTENDFNYMSFHSPADSDHFNEDQNGRLWFIVNYARWRAYEGMEFVTND